MRRYVSLFSENTERFDEVFGLSKKEKEKKASDARKAELQSMVNMSNSPNRFLAKNGLGHVVVIEWNDSFDSVSEYDMYTKKFRSIGIEKAKYLDPYSDKDKEKFDVFTKKVLPAFEKSENIAADKNTQTPSRERGSTWGKGWDTTNSRREGDAIGGALGYGD